jgi:hypothetical protein
MNVRITCVVQPALPELPSTAAPNRTGAAAAAFGHVAINSGTAKTKTASTTSRRQDNNMESSPSV